MKPVSRRRKITFLALLMALWSCGDGGHSHWDGPATIPPLAYVVSQCSENTTEMFASQKLLIRQANGDVITIKEFPRFGPFPPNGLCLTWGTGFGWNSIGALPFQRLGVSPDASTVVFEVTDDFSILAPNALLPMTEEEGLFAVQADGSGLRRLGPASRDASFRLAADPSIPGGLDAYPQPILSFSPNGRSIAFTDLGPGPSGEEAIQIVTLDLVTGERVQRTLLPPLSQGPPVMPPVLSPWFLSNDTIEFNTVSADGIKRKKLELKADGTSELTTVAPPEAVPDSSFVPEFSITGAASVVPLFWLPGTPVNQLPGGILVNIKEIYSSDGENLLQLTNFSRVDTGGTRFLSADRQRVLFQASVDPFGTNPGENCQLFSIDVLGSDLRQVTACGKGDLSAAGCVFYPGRFDFQPMGHQLSTETVLFYSNCDTLGTNTGDVFAMQFDGTNIQQLTHTRGIVTEADGTLTVELPGPAAFGVVPFHGTTIE